MIVSCFFVPIFMIHLLGSDSFLDLIFVCRSYFDWKVLAGLAPALAGFQSCTYCFFIFTTSYQYVLLLQ